MMLKDHSSFKYVYGSRFMGQSKDKICVFKMSIDLPRSRMDLIECMQVGKDIKSS